MPALSIRIVLQTFDESKWFMANDKRILPPSSESDQIANFMIFPIQIL